MAAARILAALTLATVWNLAAVAEEKPRDWSPEATAALEKAGKNRAELEKALADVPAAQKPGLLFLIANMPDRDLKELKAAYLLENLEFAYKARAETPWGKKIPEAIFFNNVVPYINVDEVRDPWRKELYELCMPIVKDCKTPAEAAHKLNSTIYTKLKVRYSTERKKAQQSPKESMENGTASCTGLSILLSDSCRSVCIPTRIAGTPLWADKRGNHTWVEVWDDVWHFTGACEPDPNGLDRGWFVGDAARAKKDVPEHAIYASSFQKTATAFPLVWAPYRKDVYAENVTDRYAKPAEAKPKLWVRVIQAGKRVAETVTLTEKDNLKAVQTGVSRNESADTNDFLEFTIVPGKEYILKAGTIEKPFKAESGPPQTVTVELPTKK